MGGVPLLAVDDAIAEAKAVGLPPPLANTNLFRALLNQPDLAKVLGDLVERVVIQPRLDSRLRELCVMRVAWRTGSVSEWTNHWYGGLRAGLTELELADVRDWRSSDRFGPLERAVLAAADETVVGGRISDETLSTCAEMLRDIGLVVELVVAINHGLFYSNVLRTLDVPLDEGRTPWPPDGRAPSLIGFPEGFRETHQ
jgi:alkylhydroperoxidase family enzyme